MLLSLLTLGIVVFIYLSQTISLRICVFLFPAILPYEARSAKLAEICVCMFSVFAGSCSFTWIYGHLNVIEDLRLCTLGLLFILSTLLLCCITILISWVRSQRFLAVYGLTSSGGHADCYCVPLTGRVPWLTPAYSQLALVRAPIAPNCILCDEIVTSPNTPLLFSYVWLLYSYYTQVRVHSLLVSDLYQGQAAFSLFFNWMYDTLLPRFCSLDPNSLFSGEDAIFRVVRPKVHLFRMNFGDAPFRFGRLHFLYAFCPLQLVRCLVDDENLKLTICSSETTIFLLHMPMPGVFVFFTSSCNFSPVFNWSLLCVSQANKCS